jgi:hypothetical protein
MERGNHLTEQQERITSHTEKGECIIFSSGKALIMIDHANFDCMSFEYYQ